MGEVFLAEDLSLDRRVALKFLPDAFTGDPERMARFEREAKILASLNHPNIAGIYGLEQADGKRFLVLEYVAGATLQARLRKGSIPLEEALAICRQIAEGLEAAHEKGIIHRDLKPANVMIAEGDKIKILDFGLAKALADELQIAGSPKSPTITGAMTRPGVILGTAAYMSPEQAKGKRVDKRADIWAFGCIIYECLTGKRAFEGETGTETLAAIMKSDPNWNRLPPNLHPRIRLLLERCLEKDSKNRYSGISDARFDIQKVLADPGDVLVQSVTEEEPQRKLQMMLPWFAVVAVLTAVIAGAAVWILKPPEPQQVTQFVHYLTEDQQFANRAYPFLAVSPDGRQLAYSTTTGLFLRSMDRLDARCISAANENTSTPFFSPDSNWVGYCSWTDNKLKKVFLNGGPPVNLCGVSREQVVGASWGSDGMVVYGERGKGIMRIPASGGIPETLIPSGNEIFYHPQMLPDGKSVMFTLGPAPYRIAIQSLKSHERKILFSGDRAWYLPTGHIVFALGYSLYAVTFDPATLQAGTSLPVVEELFRFRHAYAPQYAISLSGTLIYLPKATAAAATERNLVWVDRMGKEQTLKLPPQVYHNPRISPDGKQVALDYVTGGNRSIWIWDLYRENLTPLTPDAVADEMQLWTADGQRILFSSSGRGGGRNAIYSKAANGTGEVVRIGAVPGFPGSWGDKDGSTLILTFLKKGYENDYDIGSLSMKGDDALNPLLNQWYSEFSPRVSPDGKWLAYISTESGREEIYLRPYPAVNKGKWQISSSGGNDPLWSPDGQELFYRNNDAVIAVFVKTETTLSIEKPKTLFQGNYIEQDIGMLDRKSWDISPDGKRFLMMKPVVSAVDQSTAEEPQKIIIVLNWFEKLKERLQGP